MDKKDFHLVKNEETHSKAQSAKPEKALYTGATRKIALWVGSVIVLVFAAIAFILVPAMVGQGRQTSFVFGSFDKKNVDISPGSTFTNLLSQKTNRDRTAFRDAFETTIFRLAIESAVLKSGYVAPDVQIDREMLPYFQDSSGKFSTKAFRDTPASTKITLRKQINDNLIVQRYANDMYGSGTFSVDDETPEVFGRKMSSAESAFYKTIGENVRDFTAAYFSTATFPESETIAFATENIKLFTKHNIFVVSFASEDEAKGALKQIQNNDLLFEDALKEISLKYYADDQGKITPSYFYQIKNILSNEDDVEKITALKKDEMSEIVKTVNGYSIFKGTGETIPPDFTDSTVINEIAAYIRSYEMTRIEDYYVNTAKDLIAEAARTSFDAACTQFGAQKTEAKDVALNYGNSPLFTSTSIPGLYGIEKNENALKTAFALKEGETSSPVIIDNNVVVLHLTRIGKKTVDESGTTEALESAEKTQALMLKYYSTQWDEADAKKSALSDKRTKDNFDNTYYKYTTAGASSN